MKQRKIYRIIYLQKEIERILRRDSDIEEFNEDFTDAAFDSHPKAYDDAGFWDKTSFVDKVKICKTPSPMDTIFSPRGWKQGIELVILGEKSNWGAP